jgi:hypothetical protein
VVNLNSATIAAGGYYLIQLASNGANGVAIPVAETTNSLNLSASQGKVALVNSTVNLGSQCPSSSSIIDKVGYGTTSTTCNEIANAPTASNTTAVQRKDSGCTDTDDNSADFAAATPNPRNSSSATHTCGVVSAPGIDTQPQSRTNNAGTTATFTVTAAGGSLSYLWKKGGSDITDPNASGITSATLTIMNVIAANAGSYQVSITNTAGSTNSQVVTLTVIDPVISTQPTSRTNFTGQTTVFQTFARGTPTLSYQWYKDNNPLSDTGNVSGSATNELTITNLVLGNAGDYFFVVTNSLGSVTSVTATLGVKLAPAMNLAFWNFNDTNATVTAPPPASGSGTAALVGGTTATYAGGSSNDTGGTNQGWNTTSYPAYNSNNKLAGVQFNVSTVSNQNIQLSWEQRHSPTASKYCRLQYTTDGTTFTDADLITMTTDGAFVTYSSDLSAKPGVNNNMNFGFRIVAEWENTATGGGTNAYVGTGSAYGTGGTIRFDLVSVLADPLGAGPSPIPLAIVRVGSDVVLTWSAPAFSLASSTNSVTGPYNKIAGTSPATNAITGKAQFFRLVWP